VTTGEGFQCFMAAFLVKWVQMMNQRKLQCGKTNASRDICLLRVNLVLTCSVRGGYRTRSSIR
jgi:hypothetical protein